MPRRFPIERISVLTPGSFPETDPARGLEETLVLFERAERFGYDGAWVRQRHLENSVSSSATLLAAATQRTSRMTLGSAVIQMDYETPFRLAEDLATVDALSGGRSRFGLSAGKPALAAWLGDLYPNSPTDPTGDAYGRIRSLVEALRGLPLGPEDARINSAAGSLRPRVQPMSPGLTERLWYGGGSIRSIDWAAQNGFHLLVGNINSADGDDGFARTQRRHIERFRAKSVRGGDARVEVGRVILPLDGASVATRRRYRQFVESRTARTRSPQGERRVQFAPDLIGNADEIVATLLEDIAVSEATELRIELPYNFDLGDCSQILEDFSRLIAPRLGWQGLRRLDLDRPSVDGMVVA